VVLILRELHANPKPERKTTPLEHRGCQLRKVTARMQRLTWGCDEPTNTSVVLHPPDLDWAWTLKLGDGPTSGMNVHLGGRELPKVLRGEPAEPPTRLVHLAGGYKAVGVPTPFPSKDRPWTEGDEVRLGQQAAVAERILLDTLEMVRGVWP